MRVLQLIDSLAAGGAERIAVDYANGLSEQIDLSALVATRQEGVLKAQLSVAVNYLFLQRKSAIDFKAVFRLKAFVKKNKITIVHAHGTSFFIAFLLKLVYPKVKIIWHEHYGARAKETLCRNWIQFLCTRFFDAIFVVNQELEDWVLNILNFKKVYFIPNFAVLDYNQPKTTFLQGAKDKRILCLANLKTPKNHLAIISAFNELQLHQKGWTLHFAGTIYNDTYSDVIKDYIYENNLGKAIFLLGVRNDVAHLLSQTSIGILASNSEGFPVTLLEYGLAQLAVVSTNVGYCSSIIKEGTTGLLFDPSVPQDLQQKLYEIINKPIENRQQFGVNLRKVVEKKFSKGTILKQLLLNYRLITQK
jgi:glycosyltransferase involved in cell wall biosynthesis